MLSAACPACGRPAPVSLAAPTVLRCPACRNTFAMPPHAVQNLYQASQLLAHSNVRERQLTAEQTRALASATSQNVIYFLVLGVTAFPAFCFAVAQIGIDIEEDSEDWIQASTMLVTPFFVVMTVGIVIFLNLRKRRRLLQDACAAAPPAAPGEPCACHVCGAPLSAGNAAVVRCAHCSADNVVAADVVARTTRHRAHVLADYAAHLRSEIATVNQVANRATLLSFASALLLPPATIVVLVLIVFPLIMIQRPADESVRYTHQVRASGDCIAKITTKRAGGAKLHFGASWSTEESFPEVKNLDGLPILHTKDFIGRNVIVDDKGTRGLVAATSSDVITGNHLDVRIYRDGKLEPKASEHPEPENCCLASH